jgi:hypothetical protein
MRYPKLPEPWVIAEVERMRRVRELEVGDRASIPLPPSMEREPVAPEPVKSTVIVIEL